MMCQGTVGRASPGRGNSVRASYLSVLEVMKLRMRRGSEECKVLH